MAAYQNARRNSAPNRNLLHVGALVGAMGILLITAIHLSNPEFDDQPTCESMPGPGVNWANCLLEDANFNGSNLSGAKLRNARLRSARLVGVRLTNADLAYAELAQADLSHANLSGATLLGANLHACDLGSADLNGADLAYADLSGANIGGASFSGARLDHAIWVDGSVCLADSQGECRRN